MSSFLIPNRRPRKHRSIEEVIAEAEMKEAEMPDNPSLSSVKPKDLVLPTTDFSIEEIAEGYGITGISYCGGIVAYDFAENVLPEKTLDERAEHALNARKDEFVAASAPLVYAICKTLCVNKNCVQKDIIEKARQALEGIIGSGKPWIHTLSRAIYKTKGKDEVIHDYKQKTQYSRKARLVGLEGYIEDKSINAEEYCQAILDTTDTVEEINEVFEWISGKKAHIYRLRITPETELKWDVALGTGNSNKFLLNAQPIDDDGFALGVRFAKNFPCVRN